MRLATVGYWRVSTDRQGRDGVSLVDQANAGKRWCAERGAELVASFIEDESAWKRRGAQRPELARALAFIRAQGGRVRYFLVYDLSRFARWMSDQTRLVDELGLLGVQLQSVAIPLADDAHGRFVANQLGSVNQFQSDLASEKISAAMLEVVRRGRSPHLAPLGYRNAIGADGRKAIEPDPEKAPLVRQAFELAASGVGPEEIAARLERAGLRGRRGARLRPQEIRAMLARRFYLGVVVSHRHGLEVPGEHEALVGRELWERAQARPGASNRVEKEATPLRPHQREHADFPLRGFVRCGSCGRPLTAGWSKGRLGGRYGYYWCWAPECRKTRAAAPGVESAFGDRLRGVALSPAMLAGVEAALAALWRESRAGEEAAREGAERSLTALRKRRDRLVEAFVFEGAVDRATYDAQLERIDAAIAAANFQPTSSAIPADDLSALMSRAKPLFCEPYAIWSRSDVHAKRRIQDLVFPRGAVLHAGQLSTPETAFVFSAFAVARARKVKVVEQNRATSNLVRLADWLREAGELARAA